MIPQVNKITVFHNRDLVGTIQMTPAKDLVIKAGTRIRIPKATCEAIIDKVETVCSENLPHVIRLK